MNVGPLMTDAFPLVAPRPCISGDYEKMARAKRHYLPGYVWHITHRCHKKEFLLKLERDRVRCLHWLFEARKRYKLCILDYMATSNHIHLLVMDRSEREHEPHQGSTSLPGGDASRRVLVLTLCCRK